MKPLTPDQQESLTILRELLPPGSTVFAIVRSVARSGMSRRIDFYCQQNDPLYGQDMRWITPHMVRLGVFDESHASWRKQGDHAGARINGCGMDMVFEATYRLGRKLYPEGFPVEGRGRNGDTSGHDSDGGYALKYRSL